MDKTLHVTIHLEGPDVDKVNVFDIFNKLAEENKYQYKINSASVNTYYNPKKEETK